MSQEKVERYKKEKANRKRTMKKEKAKSFAAHFAGLVVCVAFIGWIGYSGYIKWQGTQPSTATEISTDALTEYMSTLDASSETAD